MKIAVGTESALKLRAVEAAFSKFAPSLVVVGCKANSCVDAQPIGPHVMMTGARNRGLDALRIHPDADFIVGIESGLIEQNSRWFDSACVVVWNSDGFDSFAFSAFYWIPHWMVVRVMQEKTDLGVVIQDVTGGGEKDPMKWLSGGMLPREELLTQAVLCAALPLFNREQYKHRK